MNLFNIIMIITFTITMAIITSNIQRNKSFFKKNRYYKYNHIINKNDKFCKYRGISLFQKKNENKTNNLLNSLNQKNKNSIILIQKNIPNQTYDKINDKFLNEEYIYLLKNMEIEFEEESEYYNNNCCPQCGVVFGKKVNASKTCPDCKKKIIKRSNYFTKQGYLMSSKKLIKFEEYQTKLNNLRFYEEKFCYIDTFIENDINIKELIQLFRKKKYILNEKDLLWNICSYLSSESSFEAVKRFKKIENKNIIDIDITETHEIHCYLIRDLSYQVIKIKIMEHEHNINMVRSLVSQYIYCYIIAHYILVKYDIYNICTKKWLKNLINSQDIIRYLNKYNLDKNTFKEDFYKYSNGYPINIISKEDAWNIINIFNDTITLK